MAPPILQNPADALAPGPARRFLETEILPAYVAAARWFGGKGRKASAFTIVEWLPFSEASGIAMLKVAYEEGGAEVYQVPVRCHRRALVQAAGAIADIGEFVLSDALHDAGFRATLWQRITGAGGPAPASRVLEAEQSNSSLLYDGAVFVKVTRKLQAGHSPEVEILRFLTAQGQFTHIPAFVGSLEHTIPGEAPMVLAVAVQALPNHGDAWTWALRKLGQFYERIQPNPPNSAAMDALIDPLVLRRVVQLGTRTGELHTALGAATNDAAFTAEAMTDGDLAEMQSAVLEAWGNLSKDVQTESRAGQFVRETAAALASRTLAATKIRTHGDYHLGQVLDLGDDFAMIDFEGEPSRPLAERRRKRSPLRDVAGMLRSFHYAAHAALREFSDGQPALESAAEIWAAATGRAFLEAWIEATHGASFCPPERRDLELLLDAFLLEKVLYEIDYETRNRPAWIGIPLRGLQRLGRRDA